MAAVILSLLSHLAVATAAAHVGSWGHAPLSARSVVELEIVDRSPPARALPEQPVAAATTARRRPPALRTSMSVSPATAAEPAVSAAPPARAPARAAADLSPLHVASLAVAPLESGGQAIPSGEQSKSPEPAGAAKLDALLAEATQNTMLSSAPDPVLKHQPDGSYTYQGGSLSASIDPDGQVHFYDKYFEFDFKRMSGWVDLFGWIEHKHHADPLRSRRRWFLERTEELRETLAAAAQRERAQLRGDALLRALRSIWGDPQLSLARRKQETLRLWDAQPVIADDARALILSFVRERCPVGSACAFAPAELATFNAGRSGAPFAP